MGLSIQVGIGASLELVMASGVNQVNIRLTRIRDAASGYSPMNCGNRLCSGAGLAPLRKSLQVQRIRHADYGLAEYLPSESGKSFLRKSLCDAAWTLRFSALGWGAVLVSLAYLSQSSDSREKFVTTI